MSDDRIPLVRIQETGQVLYSLQPKQWEAYTLTPLYRGVGKPGPVHLGFGGAAGGGKSYWSRSLLCTAALTWPGSCSIIFRQTEGEVYDNHVFPMQTEVPEFLDNGERMWSWNGERMCLSWENGSRTYFGFLRTEADVLKYQGRSYDLIIFEEATHYSFQQVRWLTGNRLRSSVEGTEPFAVYPSNPGGKGHGWYKRLFIDRVYYEDDGEAAHEYAFVQSFLADNQVLQERDPKYGKRLNTLPEPYRSWLRDGDFTAGAGSALSELHRKIHLVDRFRVPDHWPLYGSFDWGYAHPWSFGLWAVNEDGRMFRLDTVTGMGQYPPQIVQSIRSAGVPLERLEKIVAGHDLWSTMRARGEQAPSLFEQFAGMGMICTQADIDRKQGLQSVREALAWRNGGPDGTPGEPRCVLLDTPGNRKAFRQLEGITVDPDDFEDTLKVHADHRGEGGDDTYDEFRYFIHSTKSPAENYEAQSSGAWDPRTLQYEAHSKRLVTDELPDTLRDDFLHPEFGAFY